MADMGIKNLFSKSNAKPASGVAYIDKILVGIANQLQRNGNIGAEITRSALSMESVDPVRSSNLENAVTGLATALEGLAREHISSQNANYKLTAAQMQAATAAGVLSGDVMATVHQPVTQNVVSTEHMRYIGITTGQGDCFDERGGELKKALEAYDERDNRNVTAYSVAYNMMAARQDEFGETFFPTVVVTNDQIGFTISIRLVQVMDEVRRQISGALNDFKFRNIIDAVIDPTILRNDQTKLVPVYRDESKANFVPATLIAPQTINLEGTPITTAPLAIGKKFSLLGISQTEALLETGLMDVTDAIDSSIKLDYLYLRLKGAAADGSQDEAIQFNTGVLQYSQFNAAVQGNYRAMQLNFHTKGLQVGVNTRRVDGSSSVLLAPLVTGKYTVRLSVDVFGSVNQQLGETSINAGEVTVVSVSTVDGTLLDSTDLNYQAVAELFEGAAIVGYDLNCYRTNSNRRQRGQLLNTNFFSHLYGVPLRSPITIPRPVNSGEINDASDIGALITATHIRASNAAVDALFDFDEALKQYAYKVNSLDVNQETLGVGSYLVRPQRRYADFDVAVELDSLKSSDRINDLQSVLVNKLRDMAYRLYLDSGYKAAADAQAGGVGPIPTVIIGTDPVTAGYLMITGDLRTFGNGFDVKIVSTLNERMRGKIFMTFGYFNGNEGTPNPLHFGNMAWKPELTLTLPIYRNGATSKELTVQPSFTHIVHLPILGVMDIKGIEEVVASKVSLNVNNTVVTP